MKVGLATGMIFWTLGLFAYCFIADNHLQRYSGMALTTVIGLAMIGWYSIVSLVFDAVHRKVLAIMRGDF